MTDDEFKGATVAKLANIEKMLENCQAQDRDSHKELFGRLSGVEQRVAGIEGGIKTAKWGGSLLGGAVGGLVSLVVRFWR